MESPSTSLSTAEATLQTPGTIVIIIDLFYAFFFHFFFFFFFVRRVVPWVWLEIMEIMRNIIIIVIIILIKRCSLTRVKLTALYKHFMANTTVTYISNKQNCKYCS